MCSQGSLLPIKRATVSGSKGMRRWRSVPVRCCQPAAQSSLCRVGRAPVDATGKDVCGRIRVRLRRTSGFAVRGCCWAVMRASCEHTETAVAHILYSSSQPGLPLMWWRGKHSKASIDLAMERSSDFAVQQASAYRNGVHNDRIAARFWRADYVMRLCKKEEHPWHCNESAFSSWQNLPFA